MPTETQPPNPNGNLVITRKEHEEIKIGPFPEDLPAGTVITINVARIDRFPSAVRLAIQAPRTVPIHKAETFEAIHAKSA